MRELNFSGVRADGSPLLNTEDGAPVSGRFMGKSAFASHVLVPASSVIVVPDDLDPVMAARAARAARAAGATRIVDGATEDLAAAIHEALGGPADVAFDASGAPEAVLADVTVLKADGRISLAAGGFSKAAQSPVATGKSVENVLVGDQMPHVFIPRLIDLYRSGLIDLDAVITRYPLADIDRALADTRAGMTDKAILIP